MNGHQKLIADLEDLLAVARALRFHDFESESGMPKLDLINRLAEVSNATAAGRYDDGE